MTAASDGAQTGEGAASSIQGSVQQTVQNISNRAVEGARGLAEGRKDEGAERIGGVAQAIESAAEQIERELPQAAEYIREAAHRLHDASSMVRERSVEDLIGMVDDFARRQPAAFFGGSVVAGFLLSRFLKSSNSRRAGGRSGSDGGSEGRSH